MSTEPKADLEEEEETENGVPVGMGAGSSRGPTFLLHGFSHRESGRLLHPAW